LIDHQSSEADSLFLENREGFHPRGADGPDGNRDKAGNAAAKLRFLIGSGDIETGILASPISNYPGIVH
jgi:hypothetical protein